MCQGKPTKKVGKPDRDVLLCQALEKMEIRSNVIRCEDSAIMSQNSEIILVLSSPNVKDSLGVEKSVQVLPQTIRAETLSSVFTRAAVKNWLIKNSTVSDVGERKKYSYRSNYRRSKIICEKCSHVNSLFSGHIKPGFRGQKKRLKFDYLALNQNYLRAVIGLGRRNTRKSKARSLLKGIETIECVESKSGISSYQPTRGDYVKQNMKSLLYPDLLTSKDRLPEQSPVQIFSCNRAGPGNHDLKNCSTSSSHTTCPNMLSPEGSSQTLPTNNNIRILTYKDVGKKSFIMSLSTTLFETVRCMLTGRDRA